MLMIRESDLVSMQRKLNHLFYITSNCGLLKLNYLYLLCYRETSCRLRFGAHSEWLGAMDTDEYLVPQGEYMNLKDLLKDLSKEGLRIFSFHSQRARPRFNKLA